MPFVSDPHEVQRESDIISRIVQGVAGEITKVLARVEVYHNAPPRLMDKHEAAKYLGRTVRALEEMVRKNMVPVVRYPGEQKWWFDRIQLDKMIDGLGREGKGVGIR